MEDFRGIEEESFPSFLTNSLLGSSSILENVTVSSNLGLPVAVSTLARERANTNNRCSDIQASYLVEERFSTPYESSQSSQSDVEPKQMLKLSFPDDKNKNHVETQHLSHILMRESSSQSEITGLEDEQIKTAKSFQGQDSPVLCLQSSWTYNKECKIVGPDTGTHFEEMTSNSELSQASVLENEKLKSLTVFEDSSDDDIGDEEIYDDHLETYFKQLAFPGVIYEDIKGQEIAENGFNFPTNNSSQESRRDEVPVKTVSALDVKINPVCFHYTRTEKKMNLPQSIDNQNEEAKWVTDLTYYTSFKNEQDLNTSLINEVNEDFISGSEVLALIARDEEEFNKEHQFMQEENIDAQNTAVAPGDTSWRTSVNFSLLKKSISTSDLDTDDPNYLRLSIGEFFAQRSEALGCLGGDNNGNNVKRPSFGYFISSPEEREPVALLRKSDVSRNLEKEMDNLNHNLFAGDLIEPFRAQLNEESFTLDIEETETTSQDDESDVTLTADKGKQKDIFLMNSKPRMCKDENSDSGDSVLRISTIASAISNATINTEPSHLAAMIKSLSNKTREKTFKEANKPKSFSIVSHFSLNGLEKSNCSNSFDMEKYLKKTELSRSNVVLENFPKADESDNRDLSLSKEHTTHPNGIEPEEYTEAPHSENGENKDQESFRNVNCLDPVFANISEKQSTIVDVNTYPSNTKFPDFDNNEKVKSVSRLDDSFSLVNNSTVKALLLLKEREEIENNTKNQKQNERVSDSNNSEKLITLENHSTVSPGIVDVKDPSLEHGGRGTEDDQDSFRPSASPLSHSSPSEVSETAFSGCALECLGSTAHHQKTLCESALSELASSHASVSRLTYLSEQESSCPLSSTDYGHEDHKSNITSELSTTIIRASPTPLEEHTVENLEEKVQYQGKEKRTLSYVIQNNFDKAKVTETIFLNTQTKDVRPYSRMHIDLSSESGDLFETNPVGFAPSSNDLEQINIDLPSRACLSHPALSPAADLSPSCPESGDRGQKIAPKDTLPSISELSGQMPNRAAHGTQTGHVPSSEGNNSALETQQHLPAAIPACLPGPSLSTSFAQQYFGALSSAGNVALPTCHVDGATVYGFSGSCPHPALSEDCGQNSVAGGVCLGQKFTSGLMVTSAFCNPHCNALNQKLPSAVKPFPVQSGTRCGIGSWDSGRISEFGNVRVPEELRFPHACCVGIVSQTHLSVLNPTDHWLQVSIGVLSVSVNGEKVDLSTYPCLLFKNKIIIRPHATEDIKVLFIPSNPGIFRCIFSIASWPFSADAETVVQAEALASKVILTAVAETPVIEVETGKKDVLDFGDLIYGGYKALPLKLINRTHSAVPIRLVINANLSAWHCFTFSKEPVNTSLAVIPFANVIAQPANSSVINHVMPASYNEQDPEFLIVWVLFCNQKKQICTSEILDPAEEFLARVDVELDSPNPTPVITSVRLRARTGIARIHAPKDLQTIQFFASEASTKQLLPLRNAGNIDVYLDIRIPDKGSHFSVDPENLFLKPGEECEVTVSFNPKDSKSCEKRIMKIFVQPFGPQYEVVLKGEVVSSGNMPLTRGSCYSDIPSILSNKRFLTWGGIPLGRTQFQKLALRNNSTSITQHLQLIIRGQDQDCFQLQHIFGTEERLTSNCEIRIHPKEDINICVLFAPTRLSCMLAKLEIKQLGIESQVGSKFTIPLTGYGGTSNLILEDVKKLHDSYMVTVNDINPGKESRFLFSIRNTGSRAAFVKAVCFKDSQRKVLLDPKVMRIFPDKFVLKERSQKHITVIYNPTETKSTYGIATEISTILFFGGDEILRQQYRRAVLQKPGIRKEILPEHSLLQSLNFAETFQDELVVTEVYDLPQQPNDIQLFYGNMHKITLSVIGEFRDSISRNDFVQASSKASVEFKSESEASREHNGNISLDVLPVKGPQESPCLSQAVYAPKDKLPCEEVWTVQPEHLILLAPSQCDMAKTRHFQISNNSMKFLKFELYWPAHCLTVTPQHGVIKPESKLKILVSPNSSLSTKNSVFPWSGLIYIHCDNGQKKIVKVQIQEDLTQEEHSSKLWASNQFGILPSASELSVGHLVKPLTQPPSTKVEIRNKMLTFPTMKPGAVAENYLELENHGNTEVKWHLSSLAPPYVKDIDENGDVFRVPYAVFRCTPVSGSLESHRTQKVSITFLPRNQGSYAQFWDVECHPVKDPHVMRTLLQFSGQGSILIFKPIFQSRQIDLTHHGVYAPEDAYVFLPTKVGDSRTLKVNLRNNSFITHLLKFLSPREPFYIRHSKYSLRAQHYINMPVQFRPQLVGTFEALLVIQSDEGKSIAIQLIGEALEK
ncbi:centrosomal protein of 192 kDa [Rhynchocyon petersi]